MITLKELYEQAYERDLVTWRDMAPLMDTLLQYAKQCPLITELGVRTGCTTAVFLEAHPRRLISYDVAAFEYENEYREAAQAEGVEFVFIRGDDCAEPIKPTDLLFIDTIHTYAQLDKELAMHADNVGQYIIMHDTYTDNYHDSPGSSGMNMWIAILKLCAMGKWRIKADYRNSFGLTVLERVGR